MNYVVHMTECKPHSTIASVKVARFISDTLGIELVDTSEKAKSAEQKIKHLIIVNGPMAFCDFLEPLSVMVWNAENVIWVQQDYTISPPSAHSKAQSPFRKVFADRMLRPMFWTTCKNNVKELGDKYINWNQLTYEPMSFRMMKDNHVLYYGAFREKRIKSFERFFLEENLPLTISTTTLRRKKFEALGVRANFVPPFENVIREACHFDAALYIEDEKSHKEFHSPANRFYEMLSAGVPIFFDIESVPMLKQAGIYVPEKWCVKNGADLYQKYMQEDLITMRQEQRVMWDKDYVSELKQRLLEIWKELNGS